MVEFMTKETWKYWKKIFQLYLRRSMRKLIEVREGDLHPEEQERYI
jgi:hypothetical protein